MTSLGRARTEAAEEFFDAHGRGDEERAVAAPLDELDTGRTHEGVLCDPVGGRHDVPFAKARRTDGAALLAEPAVGGPAR